MRLKTIVNAAQALKELLDHESKPLPISHFMSAVKALSVLNYELQPLLEKEIDCEVGNQD